MTVQLFDWQQPSCEKLTGLLRDGNIALDHSGTGIGKTFISLEAARRLDQKPFVIAPKSALTGWQRVADSMGIELRGVYNIEKVKLGKTEAVKRINKKFFQWQFPKGQLVIFDEVHMCGGIDTANSVLLAQAKQAQLRVAGLSATLSSNGPLSLRAIGYLCGFHPYSASGFFRWCLQNGCYRNPWRGIDFSKGPGRIAHLEKINRMLEPFSTRLTVDQVPGFPDNLIVPELIDVPEDQKDEVNAMYSEMPEEVKKEEHPTPLVQLLRARQRSEYYKVPLLIDAVCDTLDEERSVVVFLNFLEPIRLVREGLKKRGWDAQIITGSVDQAGRQKAMDDFQNDRCRVIIAQVGSGGQSISLHHLPTSKYPRTSFLCPSLSAREFVQALGRIHRAGGISKAIQKVFLMAGTVEENIYQSLERKKMNIECLSDFDMIGVKDDKDTIVEAPHP